MDDAGFRSRATLFRCGDTRHLKPFAVGLVQLGDEIRVEARLTESDPAKLRFGMDVEPVFVEC